MQIPLYQIDAFSSKTFGGNPAAVCPLKTWLSDTLLQNIAAENNLSETAFIIANETGYQIRWFTPTTEVALCGHATLASAYVIFHELDPLCDQIQFTSQSGPLSVTREHDWLVLDFPQQPASPCAMPDNLTAALGKAPHSAFKATDYLFIYEREQDIRNLKPDFALLKQLDCRGIITTAKGDEVDFVSRFFAPAAGVNEDPVTGSAHCTLTPYWAEQLEQTQFLAQQLSSRGGELRCELKQDRVLIAGQAVQYLQGMIEIP